MPAVAPTPTQQRQRGQRAEPQRERRPQQWRGQRDSRRAGTDRNSGGGSGEDSRCANTGTDGGGAGEADGGGKKCPFCHGGRRERGKGRKRRRGAPVKLLLRVDWDTFLRGVPLDGETCELVGYGPVSMTAVHELLARGDPFVAALLTRGKAVVGVAHFGRQRSAHQRSALEWLYPSCAVQGCPRQSHLECDHRVDWAKTHFTVLDLLDLLGRHHHALKTRQGWGLVDGIGKRPFVAPDDPRHSRHHEAARGATKRNVR